MIINIHDSKLVAHSVHNRTPIFCITDLKEFESATETAKYYKMSPSSISWVVTGRMKTCKGKRFCRVEDMAYYSDEIAEAARAIQNKASQYEAIVAEQERVRKIHELHEKRKAAYLKAYNAFEEAKRLLEESEAEVKKVSK